MKSNDLEHFANLPSILREAVQSVARRAKQAPCMIRALSIPMQPDKVTGSTDRVVWKLMTQSVIRLAIPCAALLMLCVTMGCQEDPIAQNSTDEKQQASTEKPETSGDPQIASQAPVASPRLSTEDMEGMLDIDLQIRARKLNEEMSQIPKSQGNLPEDELTTYVHNGETLKISKSQASKLQELDAIMHQLQKNAKRRLTEDQAYEKKMEQAEEGLDKAEKQMEVLRQEEKILEAEHEFREIMAKELKKALEEEQARGRFHKVGTVKATDADEVLITAAGDEKISKGTALLVIRDGTIFTTLVMDHRQEQGIVAKKLPNGKELNEGDQVVMINQKARTDPPSLD